MEEGAFEGGAIRGGNGHLVRARAGGVDKVGGVHAILEIDRAGLASGSGERSEPRAGREARRARTAQCYRSR